MFTINDDMSIYVTRGDVVFFSVTADENGENYVFQPGEVVRFKVTEKKACENVVLEKDFPVTEETEVIRVFLTEEETRIGDVISKPTDFWYEIELNPFSNPQTILGYDEDGAKIFKLYPEGAEVEPELLDPEEIPVVDEELDLTSERPVQNQAVARALASLEDDVNALNARFNVYASLKEGSTTGDAELADIRVAADGTVYESAGKAIREQIKILSGKIDGFALDLITPVEEAAESAIVATEAREGAELAAEQAENSATAAKTLVDTAKGYNDRTWEMIEEQNKRLGIASFGMDETGNLTYTDDTAYDFAVDDEGMLNYTVAK